MRHYRRLQLCSTWIPLWIINDIWNNRCEFQLTGLTSSIKPSSLKPGKLRSPFSNCLMTSLFLYLSSSIVLCAVGIRCSWPQEGGGEVRNQHSTEHVPQVFLSIQLLNTVWAFQAVPSLLVAIGMHSVSRRWSRGHRRITLHSYCLLSNFYIFLEYLLS
jgi:hypothetical protein